MKWHEVQTEAKKQGRLIYAMSQGQTDVVRVEGRHPRPGQSLADVKRMPGPWGGAYQGFCLGAAIRWIALRYGGSEFAYDSKTQELEMPDWEVTRDQNVYLDAPYQDFPDRYASPLAQYGLTLNKGRMIRKLEHATGHILRCACARGGNGCYLITLSGVSLWNEPIAHAVAMQSDRTGWRFFDSNYGCFSARNLCDGLENFGDWYMATTEYDVKYSDAVEIVGINPPPFVLAGFGPSVEDLIKRFGD
jgi:hypothetical protein